MRLKYVGKEDEFVAYGISYPKGQWVTVTDEKWLEAHANAIRADGNFVVEAPVLPYAAWAEQKRNPTEAERIRQTSIVLTPKATTPPTAPAAPAEEAGSVARKSRRAVRKAAKDAG